MKTRIAGLVVAALSMQASATPNPAIVKACLHTASASPGILYTPIDASAFDVIEDKEAGTTATVFRLDNDTVGTLERTKPTRFGLLFNGKETSLTRVFRLAKRKAPTSFTPYEAMWGIAQDGKTAYICATFNFDGLGKSGSFQNVRGLYLIERGKCDQAPFYTTGDISADK